MVASDNNLQVVMLPWSAFGHLIPFYHLATSLAKKGVRVSYVSTPRNIDRIPKILPDLTTLMTYIPLPMPVLDQLPEGAEATLDVENDDVQYLKLAYDLLYDPFKQFVSIESPDWIISDFAAHWMPDVAKECNVKLIQYSIFGATIQSFLGGPRQLVGEGQKTLRGSPESLTTPLPWGIDVFAPSMVFHDYEAATFHSGFYGNNASGVSDAERLAKMIDGSRAIVIRSSNEFEGEFINLYKKLINKPVLPIGMLPTTTKTENQETTNEITKEAFKWLDQQTPNTVSYVGFGSEYKLTKQEVYEVAYGLELAEVPFIWALRRPSWARSDDEALPEGFLSRTSKRGIVCFGWVPQAKILGHTSVGVCLVHGGWGSIVETLQHGHNLVVLPFVIDQGLNARMLEAKGWGIEVKRGEDGSYSRIHVVDALKRATIGDEAERIKSRAKQASCLLFNHEESYIDGFLQYLTSVI